jgi:acetolactate synthase-1/2/3 large subunit
LLAQLRFAGVRRFFALPGGPLMPLYQGLHALGGDGEVLLARHEAGAVFAADGYARASGETAAVLVTAGPGTTNALSALAVAKRDLVPLFLIAATPPLAAIGRGAAQELDTLALLERVTKEAAALLVPGRAAELGRHLLHVARSGRRGPVALCVAPDVAQAAVPEVPPVALPVVADRTVDRAGAAAAARLLQAAKCPALLLGSGAVTAGAGPSLQRLAERGGCWMASTPRAKGVIPETHPLSVGCFGFAGNGLADRIVGDEADVLLVVGSRLGELSSGGWNARLRRKTIIQIDLFPEAIGRTFPVALGLVGDARATAEAIAEALPPASVRARGPVSWLDQEPAPPPRASRLLDPRAVFATLRGLLPPEAHLFCDIGNSMCWAIRYLVRQQPNRFHVNLTYGCMGHAVPAAVGAASVVSDPVVALVGDAALAMTGNEMAVAVEARLPGPVFIALDNGGNGMCHIGFQLGCAGQAAPALFGQPLGIGALAAANGVEALSVGDPDELREVLPHALSLRRPVLVHVPLDPQAVPPMGGRLEALSFGPTTEAA